MHSPETDNDHIKLISGLVEQYILEDSLNQYGKINEKLLPYEYYEIERTDDGLATQPKPGFQWKNEENFIEWIGLPEYFDASDSEHVKNQILNSGMVAASIDLCALDVFDFQGEDAWYVFYVPIFNVDSTVAYIQYDHYDAGYGEGNAAIFIKEQGQWKYYKFIPGWMM